MSDYKTIPMGVNAQGLTDLVNNLGSDCKPDQFIREFIQNGIEAIQRTGENGRIEVDYNQELFAKAGVKKICFIDNGDGMSPEQMLTLLNNLSASGNHKNNYKNYGVGAKIAAFTRNHAGIIYESWQHGVGHLVTFHFNEGEGVYGLKQAPDADGNPAHIFLTDDAYKPDIIDKHGTRVTLLGMTDDQDTMMRPDGKDTGEWLVKYVNTRYFRVPENVELKVRVRHQNENDSKHNHFTTIKGHKSCLNQYAESKGQLMLSEAVLYWWIMPQNTKDRERQILRGHTALVVQEEIFDLQDTRSRRHQFFGIYIGESRIVLYVEPDVSNLRQNTARTQAANKDGSDIRWDKWYHEFNANMPVEIVEFLKKQDSEKLSNSHTDVIKEKLKHLKDLYRVGRYKADPKGKFMADPESSEEHSTGHIRIGGPSPNPIPSTPRPSDRSGTKKSNLLSALLNNAKAVAAKAASPDPFPEVKWISAEAESRDKLLDRAAEYIQQKHFVYANKDFQGYKDVIEHLIAELGDDPRKVEIIYKNTQEAFETVLTEVVAGAASLKTRNNWLPSDYETALSPEALTTSVMGRLWLLNDVKRRSLNDFKRLPLPTADAT